MRVVKDLLRGLKKNWWLFVGCTFAGFSCLFTLTKAVNQFFPGVKLEGPYWFSVMVAVAVGWGIKKIWKPSKITIKIPKTSTTIEVLFGDIFALEGLRAIPANEFFDSAIGLEVSEKSLHGMLIMKCFGGHPHGFDEQVKKELQANSSEEVARPTGKTKRYPIGTAAVVEADKQRYVVFALTNTDIQTSMATATVTMMWTALHGMWKRAREACGGSDLNVPLVGSGLSKIGLPTRDLLNLLILSAIVESKEKTVTHRIRIVLHKDKYDEIDLRKVEDHWKD